MSNPSKSLPPGAERRRSPRVRLETEVSFESETNFFTGFAEDISDGGLFVATYNLQPIGTEIEVSFTLPDGRLLNLSGKVRWVRDPRDFLDTSGEQQPGMGVQFEGMTEDDKAAIAEFIAARSPLFYDDE